VSGRVAGRVTRRSSAIGLFGPSPACTVACVCKEARKSQVPPPLARRHQSWTMSHAGKSPSSCRGRDSDNVFVVLTPAAHPRHRIAKHASRY
jgi:hypothetical protein